MAWKGKILKPLQRFIYSMADSRQDMAHDLRRYSEPLLVHLLLLFYFKGNVSYRHWRGEAYGFVPHALIRFKGSSRFPNQKFLDQYLFKWLLDEDALLKLFSFKVTREGLPFPVNFDNTVDYALKRIGGMLHEVTGFLVDRHAIDKGEFFAILDKHGL
jgi:hypothetical protein